MANSRKPTFPLLVLENPLLDVQANGDLDLLSKYGLDANGFILAEERHLPLYEDLINNYNAKLLPGGAAQNSARGAQYILPPHSVVFLGAVGKDNYSQQLKSACEQQGLRVEYYEDVGHPTGRCGVIITGRERSLTTDLGAANHYKLEHLLSDAIWPLVEEANVFYVGGYHLTVCVPAALKLASHACETNKTFVLNLSAPFIPEFFQSPLAELLQYTDFVIGNESEALAWSKSIELGSDSIPVIAMALSNIPKKNNSRLRTVIITQGSGATIVAESGVDGVRTFPVHVVSDTEIVDTNGAGDAFAGGFLAGLVLGEELNTCIDMGQWLAGWNVRCLGPSFPQPRKKYGR